ncbi:hypothetical protein QQG09_06570 [Melissococcus plutonius]|uniref:hypothetical protein n=1 Tax=Melissococcus plutonius TaxID=33970 RepID=UPI0021E6279D|nr:hypothetical protein [Melissococcus plutonius]MCV2499595.1 hypothetical protein [Melissococcus plutonius]MCV2501515.1 hypothetical protein [Melissococcus plutonius]MCV2505984.1 hypothetical protein [Melissococcus plutonius]MCV2508225.1 hypothetical protein [Melissococcus plutonius]MCV2519987.1 hypothetical protein [Melissococcus plutonius]
MSKLADFGICVEKLSNYDTVHIDGHDFPVVLSHEAMEYIGLVYNDDYAQFEHDLNSLLSRSNGTISTGNITSSDWKIMKSLVYGMLCAGGLDEDPKTVFTWLGIRNETVEIFGKCMEIFSKNNYQVEDLKKSKKPQDYQKPNNKNHKRKAPKK